MAIVFDNDWNEHLQRQFEQPYYQNLRQFLVNEYATQTIYPDKYDIFNAFHYSSYEGTKVCIIGQDPYHGPGQAHGLCFSVKPEVRIPPSLLNIYKELRDDLGYPIPNHGYLIDWAKQGVLLLNAVLTVRASQPASHKNMGWENFTDHVIQLLNQRTDPVIFLLWGSFARSKTKLITQKHHHIVQSPHPSPLSASRGFFGSRPFSKINHLLESEGKSPINWQIKDIPK